MPAGVESRILRECHVGESIGLASVALSWRFHYRAAGFQSKPEIAAPQGGGKIMNRDPLLGIAPALLAQVHGAQQLVKTARPGNFIAPLLLLLLIPLQIYAQFAP